MGLATSRAVVFDLGKVLVDFDYGIVVRKIQAQCSCSPEELLRLIDQSPLLHRYERGGLSTQALFDEVCRVATYRGQFEGFCEGFADIFTEIPAMVEIHGELRRRGVPMFVLSNTNELAVRHIRARFPFFAGFDGYVLSYEQGAMKPEEKLYRVVEQLAQRSGPELVYIDDRPENIVTARDLGWTAILHEKPQKTREALRDAGML